ncbi:hypothetical protein Dacet_0563 [Denitrovibrio acetiphilus DSM 12809]|uniref:Uncharacterized protein n=1 Tax=Denitrovibrio acetiphilus (strain DSM 12809 / NBRC 114555 / N2460) TaxID=522772 RepID=D4H450_DENA2|nr:hypothetical protein [Denitrovibrio acetiphilus]ADD67361.1 hypothetical protein Dacet_0563 [Denitrovibrio acetiphilus DSM 12809]
MTREDANKIIQKNKSVVWMLMNVMNEFGENQSTMPPSIKQGTGYLLDELYNDIEMLEDFIKQKIQD